MRDQFLGNEKSRFEVTYIWLSDDEQSIVESGFATHYDTRENQPKRAPEWRLYYPGNAVTGLMSEGNTLILAKRKNQNRLIFIVAAAGSTVELQLMWLFGLQRPNDKFVLASKEHWSDEIGFAGQLILDELGIEPEITDVDVLDEIVSRFKGEFPSTREFSDLARKTCKLVDPIEDPDSAIEKWLAHEEAMFRRLELQGIRERLRKGFIGSDDVDVEGFLKFSLSVQNKRKSRMGLSFEHHLEALFHANNLKFSRHCTTENGQKPDFIFPSIGLYNQLVGPNEQLYMLAVKSTCKDRWRQVLPEAEKIPLKHLATLEPSISEQQTDQMIAFGVQLVVPRSVALSYSNQQKDWLWSFADFISELKSSQSNPR
jgi:hypothetical protein